MTSALTITDEHGNVREYPWPDDVSLLTGHNFVDTAVAQFAAEFPDAAEITVTQGFAVDDTETEMTAKVKFGASIFPLPADMPLFGRN